MADDKPAFEETSPLDEKPPFEATSPAAPEHPVEPNLETEQTSGRGLFGTQQGFTYPEGIDPKNVGINDAGERINMKTGEVIPEENLTRRPSVAPVTKTPAGEVELAMPKALELAGSLVTPLRGIPRSVPKMPTAPFGVTQSEGQAARYAGDEAAALPLIQKEQAGLRGELGTPAQKRALEFAEQQKGQVAAAGDVVTKALDPFGQVIAETPHQAGQVVSEGVGSAAKSAKAGVTKAYKRAEDFGGELHASAFENMGQGIKQKIYPDVIINKETTPIANQMLNYVDEALSNLPKLNKADPYGAVNPENITGVSLKGVDEVRKVLSKWRGDAFKPVADADTRATRAVLDAFDDHIDAAVNGGQFKGDPRAVEAWNNARAANADYRSTFTSRKGDPVGNVVSKIIGNKTNPPEVANAVANHLYGASGLLPSNTNVGVANRVKSILGVNSEGWSAVKQGLFSRLTETPKDVTDWGPGRIAQNINKFLEGGGKDLANAVYTSSERATLKNYANLMRSLEVPPKGANWSGSARGIAPMMQKIGDKISAGIGAIVGAHLGGWMGSGVGMAVGWSAGKTATAIGNRMQAAAISRQMPIIENQVRQFQKAYAKSQQSLVSPLDMKSKTRLAASFAGLSDAVRPLGIDLGTIPVAAEPEQNKRDGGRTNKPDHSAQNKRNNPPMHGARKAPDGHWYIEDKSRKGKYLRVEA